MGKEKEKRKSIGDGKVKKADKKPNEKTAPKKSDGKKPEVDLHQPKSAKAIHQILPIVFMLAAIFLEITFILNLFCNFRNSLSDPSEHWLGSFGYRICEFSYGVLGTGVFLFPILLARIAAVWKSLIDHKRLTLQSCNSVILQLLFSAFLHTFSVFGLTLEQQANITNTVLYQNGFRLVGGGVLGGRISFFLIRYLNLPGTLILLFLLLVASCFVLFGITPQHLISRIRNRRSLKKEKNISLSEDLAENALNQAKMNEKIHKVTTGQSESDSAVVPAEKEQTAKSEKEVRKPHEKKLAPMPMPHLDPTTEKEPFVPSELDKKMKDNPDGIGSEIDRKAFPTPEFGNGHPPIQPEPEKATAQPAPDESVKQDPPPLDPEKNKDTAINKLFPSENGFQSAHTVPKTESENKFDDYFPQKSESDVSFSASSPAPLPPEKPLAGSPKHTVEIAPDGSAMLSISMKNPKSAATVQNKPTFGKIEARKEEFGISDEEFEKIEANAVKLPTRTPLSKPVDAKPMVKEVEPPKPYVFPPLSYLREGTPMTEENRSEVQENMTKLADALASYRVGVSKINYSYGPTVTRYEVVPSSGVRIRSITALSDDLARVLRSVGGIRIEAPIPGTDEVGIEIPNQKRQFVVLRTLLESPAFAEAKSKLTAGLGADISGQPLLLDIARMPHLLIAGATGSGKSVCINAIIISLLYKASPSEVRMILIDPKMVEFSIYKNIPHLMAPIITSPKDAAGALQAAVDEMERRFALFEQVGVRDLKGYTALTKDDPDMPNLPQIVIIIDELADLMMTAKEEVETAICRIAQKARAAGMHLIVGTQRPSVDVVTGLIKSNIPSRIAFTVASQIDSKTILDYGGAERLVGNGDMLFVPFGSIKTTRVQGAFVDEKEVGKVCDFLRATNGVAQYDEHFISRLKELAAQCGNKKSSDYSVPSPDGDDNASGDKKFVDAIRVAVEENKISTSLLQRKLGLGYGRAAKIIDRMYEEGYVSAQDGSKPRTVLITKEQFIDRFLNQNQDSGEE